MMLGANQEASNQARIEGLIVNLQKRLYALEREVREMQRQATKGYPGYD